MTTTINTQSRSTPMTIGSPIGPEVDVTVSPEVEAVLATSTVTFGGQAAEGGSARGVHWLAQGSADEFLVAVQVREGGGLAASVYLIECGDDEGRLWFCVKSSWWTAGLFLDRSEALDFAVGVAIDETPTGGWDIAADRRVPASTYARLTHRDLR